MADKLNFLNFTAFDFETTGLDAKHEQIIEACVIRVRDGEVVSIYNTLVRLNDGTQLSPKITELTGHTVADLNGGISEESLAYLLWEMLDMHSVFDVEQPELLVAYNALFDMEFLENLFLRYGLHPRSDFRIPNPFIDPLTIARDRDPFPHKLADSCKRHNIPMEDAHTAYGDTMALVELVMAQHDAKDISEWVNVAGYRPKYGEPSWIPPHAILKKQGAEVVEHSKKTVPKHAKMMPSIVTKNKRTKNIPDNPVGKEMDKLMPSGFIRKDILDRIGYDTLHDPFRTSIIELSIHAGDEFQQVMTYLTDVLKFPDKRIGSYLDNPEEAIIEVLPLYEGTQLDISDDDLPF